MRSLILDPWPWTLLELAQAFLTARQFEELCFFQGKGHGVSEKTAEPASQEGLNLPVAAQHPGKQNLE